MYKFQFKREYKYKVNIFECDNYDYTPENNQRNVGTTKVTKL